MRYLGSVACYLYALDAANGSLNWRLKISGSVSTSPVVIQTPLQDWVIATSQDGNCLTLDAQTGKQLHAWRLGELRAAPIIANDTLYQASLGNQGLFAFSL